MAQRLADDWVLRVSTAWRTPSTLCAAASAAAVALTAWLGRRTAHVYEYHRGKVNAGEAIER